MERQIILWSLKEHTQSKDSFGGPTPGYAVADSVSHHISGYMLQNPANVYNVKLVNDFTT